MGKIWKTAALPLIPLMLALCLWMVSEWKGGNSRDASTSREVAAAAEKADGTTRILGIGNSFMADALNRHLHGLAAAGGKKTVFAHLVGGGATLEEHLDNAKAKRAAYRYTKISRDGTAAVKKGVRMDEAVSDERWDYIVFQQQSWLAGQFASYEASIPGLVDHARRQSRNPDVVFGIFQTWAFAHDYANPDYAYYDSDQMTMYNALMDATKRASALVSPKMMVVPAGTAIQNGRANGAGDVFCRDGYHLSAGMGRFTVACAWYEAIFGGIAANAYAPENMPAGDALRAKRAARDAVANPWILTQTEAGARHAAEVLE